MFIYLIFNFYHVINLNLMTNTSDAVPTAKQIGDDEFFYAAIKCRDLQDQVNDLKAQLDHLIQRRNKLDFGDLLPLGRLEEIRRLSGKIDVNNQEINQILEGLVSKFYPANEQIRELLKDIWIGVKPPTAIRISGDPKRVEIKDLPR
jgi:hypothetical protein